MYSADSNDAVPNFSERFEPQGMILFGHSHESNHLPNQIDQKRGENGRICLNLVKGDRSALLVSLELRFKKYNLSH